jgi:Amt family ammonium transporter
MFGFFAFNGGSVLTMDEQSDVQGMATAMINTVLAGAGGGLASLLANRAVEGHYQLIFTCNGLLAGMVAICGGANDFAPWAALIIGLIAGIVYFGWSFALKNLNIDDAIDAVPVHLGAGIWGVIAVPLFNKSDSIFYHNSKSAYSMLGWNIAGVFIIFAFVVVTVGCMFKILDLFGKLRIDDAIIQSGIDKHEHNETAYARSDSNTSLHMGDFSAPKSMQGSVNVLVNAV